jgi:hypothetical protein
LASVLLAVDIGNSQNSDPAGAGLFDELCIG